MNHLIRKRVFTLFLAGILAISLVACGNTNSDGNAQDISSEAPQTSGQENGMQPNTSEQVESSNAGSDGSNILIAYFTAAENSGVDAISSASYTTIDGQAVGRIRAVADMIQENVGGDLFSIHTSVVYPTDGGELIDYAAEEQDENARPELTSHIDNLDQYDTIFIGYPNWWADLPMARLMSIMEAAFLAPSRPLKSWSRMQPLLKMALPSASRRLTRLPRMWPNGLRTWGIKGSGRYAKEKNHSVSFPFIVLRPDSHHPCRMRGF